MQLKQWRFALVAGSFVLASIPLGANAQSKERVRVSTQEEIEGGATHPSQVEMRAGHSSRARVETTSSAAPGDEIRVGLQARLDALNSLSFAAPDVGGLDDATVSRHLLVPIVAPGVRLVDGRLFLGLGLGLSGASVDVGPDSTSRSGFSLTPMAHYDLLLEGPVALSLGGWLNFARLGETETCDNGVCASDNDDVTGWGLGLVGGLHAYLLQGLSLGGEFGWGFLDLSDDSGTDTFLHGLFGTIVLEASIGI